MTRGHLPKLILYCSCVLVLVLAQKYLFVVQQISCRFSDQTPCPESLEVQLQGLHNQPLLFSNLAEQAEALVATEAVTVVRVSRELPATAHIELLAAEYDYGLKTSTGSFVVTTSGQVLSRPIPESLPTIQFTDPTIDTPTSEQVQSAATLLESLASTQLAFSSLSYTSAQELQIELQQPAITVIVNPSQIATQLRAVPLILNSPEFTKLTEPVTELDMRFEMPVIRTTQATESATQ